MILQTFLTTLQYNKQEIFQKKKIPSVVALLSAHQLLEAKKSVSL